MKRTSIFEFIKDDKAEVVKRFIAALNARDAEAASDFHPDDCRLVDSTGGSVNGHAEAVAVTCAFFELEADFRLDYEEITVQGDAVLVRGQVQADDARLANDRPWKARVEQGKLTHWQGFGAGLTLPLAKSLKSTILQDEAGIPPKSA